MFNPEIDDTPDPTLCTECENEIDVTPDTRYMVTAYGLTAYVCNSCGDYFDAHAAWLDARDVIAADDRDQALDMARDDAAAGIR